MYVVVIVEKHKCWLPSFTYLKKCATTFSNPGSALLKNDQCLFLVREGLQVHPLTSLKEHEKWEGWI